MPVFAYAGKTKGKPVTAEISAADRTAAIDQLRSQGVTVTTIEEKKKAKSLFGERKQKITDKDVVIFTRQFATMINAGLPLVQCLEILATQCDNKTFGKLIGEVKMDVESGSTFADALKKQPKTFSSLYCNMVQAGEVGGALDVTLQRLANQLEKTAKLKAQIKSAMIYPSAIVGVAIIVVSVLMVFVIPIFAKMFTDFGGALPGPTLLVINVSDFMQKYIILMIIAAGAGVWGLKKYYATPAGRLQIDTLALKAPVAGDLIRKIAVAQFTRTFGTLLQSGVPIMEGLEIVARIAGNKVVENAILAARTSVGEGKSLSEPLGTTGVFPPMVVQMINVGEATGALDAMLSKIADFYDDEVDTAVAALTSLLEPMLMVFLGTVIGFIVIAMYLPIFKMASVIG
ncbi:MAG TPA: type II secretion system F family protein [Nitrospirales bacterium]|jgi:type IV pilus assembly protein PilC|nr:type II secretion system F family protein [Nitrospirales bacterium]